MGFPVIMSSISDESDYVKKTILDNEKEVEVNRDAAEKYNKISSQKTEIRSNSST